ncbi:MAG: hypothetical protein P4L33_20395 [Capsulimonadaceae bacterium]|nr:hypothetical protein [Capsulimonadaceae bacterium]
MSITARPWRVQDELIEQPSWGGRYIIDLKGLSDDPEWTGKKVGQSYELARSSSLIDPASGDAHPISELLTASASELLGECVLKKFGSDLSLLIKLTQAKGNSFQVHLPVDKKLGHWLPKPESWFYLAPGLFTFGLKRGASFEGFSAALREIDKLMHDLSVEVKAGRLTVGEAGSRAKARIAELDPYQYVNVIEAGEDEIVDLTAGGIHHSWEDDETRFPQGNLVYEVQVDVADPLCSMRGFDKGKFLADGSLRPTHVEDYLATIERDDYHNDLSHHIRKPRTVSSAGGAKVEVLFETPYFLLDRITLSPGASASLNAWSGFHHLFVLAGTAHAGPTQLRQGQSFIVPAVCGGYDVTSSEGATIFKTSLPID